MLRMWLGPEIVVAGLPSLSHVMSHTKVGPDRISRFDVHWILKQTDRQTDKLSIYG